MHKFSRKPRPPQFSSGPQSPSPSKISATGQAYRQSRCHPIVSHESRHIRRCTALAIFICPIHFRSELTLVTFQVSNS